MEAHQVKENSRNMDLRALCAVIADASPVAMLAVAGAADVIEYVNPAFCLIARQKHDALIGKAFCEAVPADHECLALLQRVHRTAQPETHIPSTESLQLLCWSYVMWPIVALDGQVTGILMQVTESGSDHQRAVAMNQALIISSLRLHEMLQDAAAMNLHLSAEVADRKRAQDDLQRANNDLEQFTYAAGHDLQEPLRTLTAYTQLLARRHRDALNSDADMLVNEILNGSKRMSALISDLLAYARVGTAGILAKEPVSCGEVVKAALANLQGSISDASAQIRVDDPLPVVTGNFAALVQLFQNLIGNALKYSNDGVPLEIHIFAEYQDSECIVSVRDNGIGFRQEYAEQIFGIFKRLQTNSSPGTGIGLAICKRIVELHGGRIWATAHEGRGATFSFSLPVPETPAD